MLSLLTLLLIGSVCAAFGQVAFKIGADGRSHWTEFVNAWIATGLTSYALGTALWIYCLSRANLTVVYAFAALTFVLVYVAGVVMLGERLAPRGLLGIALVLCGLILLVSQQPVRG
jgi:undecaprenyl phosphate-alpha-L-ara4N flippase subunit ArnE